MNGLIWSVCLLSLTTLGLMFLFKKFKQPYLIAYIIAGILLGPHFLEVFNNPDEIEVIGEIGILLLMFFIGMEINVPDNRSLLLKPILAQSLKILLSAICAFLIGYFLKLSLTSIILIIVLFVFNSTAVVSEFLKKDDTIRTNFGIMILNMLIFQDLLLAPVLTILKAFNKESINIFSIALPILVCIAIFFILKSVRNLQEIKLPRFFQAIENDHDLQVFSGLLICLGFGLLAELIGLSSALGSFVAGVIVGRFKVFNWLEHSLAPFKIFFLTLFFVSIGLRLDVPYLMLNSRVILIGTFFMLITNSILTAFIFRLLKYNWTDSWYGGALLSQTGEFSILALSIAYKTGTIEYSLYKEGLGITCLSLLLSTIWIAVLNKVIKRFPGEMNFR